MRVVFFVLVVFMMAGFASAFSVTSLNSDARPLIVRPGDSVGTHFILNSVPSDRGYLRIEAELLEGEEIVEFDSAHLDLPYEEERRFFLRINIPEDQELGTIYNVRMLFRGFPIDEEERGNVGFVTGLAGSFPVVVGEPQASPPGGGAVLFWLVMFGFLVAILFVAVLIAFNVRKKASRKINLREGVI